MKCLLWLCRRTSSAIGTLAEEMKRARTPSFKFNSMAPLRTKRSNLNRFLSQRAPVSKSSLSTPAALTSGASKRVEMCGYKF